MRIIAEIFIILFFFNDSLQAHDAFYPHHREDLDAIAQRGKILFITLALIAGLTALISIAISRSGKSKDDDEIEPISHNELRQRVIVAANEGRNELSKGYQQALKAALSRYIKDSGFDMNIDILESSALETYNIGKDSVTIKIAEDGKAIEVSAIHGKLGASALADIDGSVVQSKVYTL